MLGSKIVKISKMALNGLKLPGNGLKWLKSYQIRHFLAILDLLNILQEPDDETRPRTGPLLRPGSEPPE